MSKASVIIRRLESEYDHDTFTGFSPLAKEMKAEINVVVKDIFDTLGGKSLLKSSGDVYIKPNAVESRPYSHTRPEVVEAVMSYWFEAGARNVYLSGECNDLRATTEAMCHLMKVNPMRLAPANPVAVIAILIQANLNRTNAKLVNPACHLFKMR